MATVTSPMTDRRDGRNTGIGPSFYDFDLRLSRAFKLDEKDLFNSLRKPLTWPIAPTTRA